MHIQNTFKIKWHQRERYSNFARFWGIYVHKSFSCISPVHQRDKNMKEVLLTIVNKTELLMVDTLEHEFLTSSSDDFMTQCCKFITCGLILGTNVPMIIFIMNQGSKTFLDLLIVFDCFLCLGNLYAVILLLHLYDFWAGFCICHVFFMFFSNLCNRLLTLGIVISRFTLVLGSSFLLSSNQKKILEKIILLVILLTSLNLTGWAVYYREDYRHFLGEAKNYVI